MRNETWKAALCGAVAGTANGLFGAGGGLLLLPLLRRLDLAEDRELFASSLAIMLPVSGVSLAVSLLRGATLSWQALPCCLGGVLGGILAGLWFRKAPLRVLHLILGLLILWGGVRQFL